MGKSERTWLTAAVVQNVASVREKQFKTRVGNDRPEWSASWAWLGYHIQVCHSPLGDWKGSVAGPRLNERIRTFPDSRHVMATRPQNM